MFFVALSRLSSTNSQDYPSLFRVWDAAEDWSMWRGQRPEHRDRGPDTLRPHTPGQPADWNKAWMSIASIPKLFESLKRFHVIFCPCYLTSTFQNGTCSNVGNVVFVSFPFPRPRWWLMCLVLEGCFLVFFWECIWHRIGHWLPKINS